MVKNKPTKREEFKTIPRKYLRDGRCEFYCSEQLDLIQFEFGCPPDYSDKCYFVR